MSAFETVRFGSIEVPDEEQIELRRGLLGFEQLRRFVHIEMTDEAPFGWLQSLDDPEIAFVVANPALFFPAYSIEIDPRELGEVKPDPNDRLLVLGICTIPENSAEATMNLQGPVVINTASRKGKQLVLNRSDYATQHRLAEGDQSSTKAKPAHAPGLKPRAVRQPA